MVFVKLQEAAMKTGKAVFVLLLLGCMAAFSPTAAQAEWVTCMVDQVGPLGTDEATSGSRIYLTAVDPPGAWEGSKQCKISPNRGKEFLAAALAAVSSGKLVKVSINPELASPTIGAIYVQK